MTFQIETHWLILGLGGLVLSWTGSLAAMWYWTRRQLLNLWLVEEAGHDILLPSEPGPEDLAALEIIRKHRDRYLWHWWPDTEFSFSAMNEMSLDLIREIAAAYYPEEERPELRASVSDLVALHNRVGSRLAAWLKTAPIRALKDVELKTIIRYYDLYQTVKNHPVSSFIKRHRLHKVASWGWAAVNYNSPFYWTRRAGYEAGRRLLLSHVAGLVGEEAMLLYGRRR